MPKNIATKQLKSFTVGQHIHLKEPNAFGGPVTIMAISKGSICVKMFDTGETLRCFYTSIDSDYWCDGRYDHLKRKVLIETL